MMPPSPSSLLTEVPDVRSEVYMVVGHYAMQCGSWIPTFRGPCCISTLKMEAA